MQNIIRSDINKEWMHAGIVEAGDYVYISYCMANEGQSAENQINGAFDVLTERLESINLTLDSVIKIDCLFKDIMDLAFLSAIIEEKFKGNYPARKAFETRFIRDGIVFQIDAVAYKG